ncbi:PcfJ domain-containing protein [Jeotgalibaca arthritidis]|uniref:PcfJ domain-containing protein n=1 Tax=Jeotgalibaca arthritidis TaxID=1868794 RepID=UPI00359F6156
MRRDANYYANNRLKAPIDFFETAYSNFVSYIWKNKDKTIVASDRPHRNVIEKRLYKKSKLTFCDSGQDFMIVLSTSRRIEIQTYSILSLFDDGKQYFESYLVNLEIFEGGEHIKVTQDGKGFKFGKKALTGMFNYMLPDVYQNEWVQRLMKVSELKYLKLWNISPEDIQLIYKYRKEIEYAQKIGAYPLAMDIGKGRNVDMRIITKNWLMRNKSFLKNSGRGLKEFRLKQAIEERGGRYMPGIELCLRKEQIVDIPKTIGINKLQNYLIKQDEDFSFYMDYRNTLTSVSIPFEEQIKFPSNLRLSHDRAVKQLNAMKREAVRKEYQERKKALEYAEVEIDNFAFFLPQSANELIEEGKVLKHCVGGDGYISSHAEGSTTIVFVRRKDAIDKPFYTMEFNHRKIQQLRGFKNQNPTKDVEAACDKWLKVITKKVS